MPGAASHFAVVLERIVRHALAQCGDLSDVDLNRPLELPESNTALVLATHLIGSSCGLAFSSNRWRGNSSVCVEHIVELIRLLGGGLAGDLVGLPRSQLAVLPGTTHVTLAERVDWLVSMVTQFLDGKGAMSK